MKTDGLYEENPVDGACYGSTGAGFFMPAYLGYAYDG
jgi:hypothetical protein